MTYVYIIVRGQRIGDDWLEAPIFNDAWTSRSDAEYFRQQAVGVGVGTITEITVKKLTLRLDLGL